MWINLTRTDEAVSLPSCLPICITHQPNANFITHRPFSYRHCRKVSLYTLSLGHLFWFLNIYRLYFIFIVNGNEKIVCVTKKYTSKKEIWNKCLYVYITDETFIYIKYYILLLVSPFPSCIIDTNYVLNCCGF